MNDFDPVQRGDLVTANWKAINQAGMMANRNEAELSKLRIEVAKLLAKNGNFEWLGHPFKIYSSPTNVEGEDVENAWRKFWVRAGRVNEMEVTGTDGVDRPDSSTLPNMSDHPLIEVDEGIEKYYFWIEVTSTAATLKHGEDPVAQGWTLFPKSTEDRILIGWVDTKTDAEYYRSIERQILRTDVLPGAGQKPVWL